MVWGCFSRHGVGNLVRTTGGIKAGLYLHIPEEGLMESIADAGLRVEEARFLHDNAPAHKARRVRRYLGDVALRVVPHLPCSSDLNPIEHLWDVLK
jgi:hypothetical protein